MPSRLIREGILTSERVDLLDAPSEVFYRRLMSKVDDHGLYDARPSVLRASLYPLRVDRVREADISRSIAACEKAGLIALYVDAGKPYLQMLDTRWTARSEPKYPLRTVENTCAQPGTSVPVVVVGVVVEDGGGKRARAPSTREKKTPIPEDFGISERVRQWADENGYGQLDRHLDAFKRKAVAKGYAYVSWDDAFMEAIREDWAKLRGRGVNGAAPPAESRPSRGPDPALEKIKADALRAAPIPLDQLERMAKLRQGAH
jgi:hypothetical protein